MIEILLRILTILTMLLLASGVVAWIRFPTSASSDRLLNVGLILLMTTPVMRLLWALAEEIRARAWRFVALGCVVLALLVGSVLIAMTS